MKQIAAIFLFPFLLAACASSPKTDSQQTSTAARTTESSQAATTGSAGKNALTEAELAAKLKSLGERSIYFDFDRYNVKAEYRDVVMTQADFIKTYKNDVVTLEGNADERGSNEYNLALGDKRANAVRKNLELLGVPAAQLKVVSFGEEKPRLACHEEECWKENRRCDFVHKLGK